MKKILYILTILATLTIINGCSDITAQTPPATTKKFTWLHPEPWTVNFYTLKCGLSSGTYDQAYAKDILGGNTFEYPVANMNFGDGKWYCTMTASNEFGESLPGNEIVFQINAGRVILDFPQPPSNLSVQ